VVAALAAAHAAAAAGQSATRTIYVSAFDGTGSALPDLQPADLVVKAGGKLLEVVRVEPATTPLQITVIVSDAGTGGFQQGVAVFMERLIDRAEFGLVSVLTQPEVVMNFSNDPVVLQSGVRRLGARGRQHGAQVMEAIQEAIRAMPPLDSGSGRTEPDRRASEVRRRVILVLRVGVEGTSPLDGGEVRERLRRSGALLYVISTASAARQPPPSARTGISAEQAQLQDDEIAASRRALAQVLGDGTRESGGRHDEIVATSSVSPALERIADELLHQYAVTCATPPGVKTDDKLSITVKRKGVKIQAPARLK
jgi:hypothetical protein